MDGSTRGWKETWTGNTDLYSLMRVSTASYLLMWKPRGALRLAGGSHVELAESRSVHVAHCSVHKIICQVSMPPRRNHKTLSQPLGLSGPHVLHIYHLLICYNWRGSGCQWELEVLIELLPPVKRMKAFLEWKEDISHEMQSHYKVQGQRITCAEGAQALLLCPSDGTGNLAFQAEKNTPAVIGARNRVSYTDQEEKACSGWWYSIIVQ